MRFHLWLPAVLACAACIAIQGCEDSGVSPAQMAQDTLVAGIAKARTIADPVKRRQMLLQAEAAATAQAGGQGVCGMPSSRDPSSCVRVPAFGDSHGMKKQALVEAANSGDLKSMRLAWGQFTREKRAGFIKAILAESMENADEPAERLSWVADQLYAGNEVMRDTHLAYTLMGRAWRQGDAAAAARAATYALEANDIGNAYMWSLRCIGAGCNRQPQLGLDVLGSKLTTEARLQAEAAARDLTVLSMPGGVL